MRDPEPLAGRPDFILEPGYTMQVEFRVAKPVSPKQLGWSDDARLLGMQLHELQIRKADPVPSHAAANASPSSARDASNER
jgi:hypothetical protein